MNLVIQESNPHLDPGDPARIVADKKYGGTWFTNVTAGKDLNKWFRKAKEDPQLQNPRVRRLR